MKFETLLLNFDPAPGDRFRPANTPIYQTATFRQDSATSFGDFDYTRSGNPTRAVLETQLALLEGGPAPSVSLPGWLPSLPSRAC